jgi:NarL family two-component system response regulator LiaR
MQEKRPIKVMLVDDHAVVRSGLAAFLMVFDDLEFVGEAGDGREAIQKCAEIHPDIVLMDLVMPEMDGATATRAIRSRWPDIQVVVLTSFKEDDLVQGALRAGAIGYLLKNSSADELASAIRLAAAGRPTLAPEAARALIHVSQQMYQANRYDLTEREKEVLGLMALGMNNLEIADRLVVSRSTVKFHVSSLLSKLEANTRTEAVAIALQNHLIEPLPSRSKLDDIYPGF